MRNAPAGEHNIQNILLAATVALHLGLTMRQVARGISKLQPVEHRLQLIPSPGITIIDDAFNSNPKGAEAAVKVLGRSKRGASSLPRYGRIGRTGSGVQPRIWAENLRQRGYRHSWARSTHSRLLKGCSRRASRRNLHVVASLDEATALLRQIGRPGDIAMFENDLPDHYSET